MKRFCVASCAICIIFFAVFFLKAQFALAAYNASDVLGQYDQNGNQLFTKGGANNSPNPLGFSNPWFSELDEVNHRLFIADSYNNRVLVFSLDANDNLATTTPSYVLGQTNLTSNTATTTQSGLNNPYGLAYDSVNSRLFVDDKSNNRVMVFDVSTSTIANGENASYVLGQTSFTSSTLATTQSGLKSPSGSAYDSVNSRLFVADSSNSRVMVFNVSTSTIANGENASYVLGQASFTSSTLATTQSGLAYPIGPAYDSVNSRLFVTDNNNSRVMVFDVSTSTIANGENASSVLGQYDQNGNQLFTKGGTNNGPNPLGFSGPWSSELDEVNHRLFIADSSNRVLVFSLDANNNLATTTPSYVLGQTNLTSNTATTTQSGLNNPYGLAYDSVNSRLFVADFNNSRVMVFNVSTSTIANGENASYVLGQTSFTGSTPATTQSRLYNPYGLAYDSVNSRLFVADYSNNRVMVFNVSTSTIANGENASYVLGQTSFTSSTSATTQSRLYYPSGPAYDSVNSRLFVADSSNNRVMVFNVSTSTIANGENASSTLGQTSFTSSTSATTQSGLYSPSGLAYDSVNSRLFVGDTGNNRVLVFNLITITTASLPSPILGQPYSQTVNTTSSQGTVTFSVFSGALPAGLQLNASTGAITGTPTAATTAAFTIEADDAVSPSVFSGQKSYTLAIEAATPASPSVIVGVGRGATSSFLINQGATSTLSPKVTLSFFVTPDAISLAITNSMGSVSATATTSYASVLPWNLCAGLPSCLAGSYLVSVNFLGGNGAVLASASQPISLLSVIPSSAAGGTTSPTIQDLRQLLVVLRARLQTLLEQAAARGVAISGVTNTAAFARNLQLWDKGADVQTLQQFLVKKKSGQAAEALARHGTTQIFGILTYSALREFQRAVGIAPASGYFGPITRAWVSAHE